MNYPAQLQQMLGHAYEVMNFGYSGMTMLKDGLCWDNHSEFPENCSYWNTDAYARALQSHPDVVTIMLGTNDGKDYNFDTRPDWGEPFCPQCPVQGHGHSFQEDYLDMISTFKTLANSPQVLVAIPPPIFLPFPWNFSSHVINEVYPGPIGLIQRIATYAQADGVIDVWTALGGDNPAQREQLYGGHCARQPRIARWMGSTPTTRVSQGLPACSRR